MRLPSIKIAGAVLAVLGSVTTILAAEGALRVVGCAVLGLLALYLAVTWIVAGRKYEQLADMDFLPRAPYVIESASEDDIRWVAQIAPKVYSGIDIMPISKMLEWYGANPRGFFIIRDADGHRCGNLDILPVKPEPLERFVRGDATECDIGGNDIWAPREGDQIRALYIESFVALSQNCLGNPLAAYRCLMHAPAIVQGMCDHSQLETVYAIAASKSGKRLIVDLGFDPIESDHPRKDKHQLFFIEFNTLMKNIARRAEPTERKRLVAMLKETMDEATL